jgi:hypothetical protein
LAKIVVVPNWRRRLKTASRTVVADRFWLMGAHPIERAGYPVTSTLLR